jgi:glycosyltransferase involved in cell wall biosynthesis
MNVAVIGTRGFPGIQGGVENHCEHLYSNLARLGCNVTVFTRKPYASPDYGKYNGVKLIPLGCPRNKFLEAIVHTFRGMIKAKELNPDILHVHAIGPSIATPFAKMMGMNVVVTNHGPDYERKKWPYPAKVFLKNCERIGVYFADEYISIAANIADNIKRKFGRRSIVIPNGVNIPQIANSYDCLKRLKIKKNKYILAVGRFVPEKGFHDLIEAFNSGDFSDWQLVIVGDADHEDSYSRRIKEQARHSKNVILTGFLSGKDLQEIYSHAGLFVLSSYYEGLPIVLLEAMSYGLSCIVSDIPANKNVELDSDRFFKAGDVVAMREKMKSYMLKSWSKRDIENQRKMIYASYNWEMIAKKTLEVYSSVINT